MTKAYSFITQLDMGKKWEAVLDTYFRQWFTVDGVTMHFERQGIDRVFKKPDGSKMHVEYKADEITQKTGNLFIETTSIDYLGRPGWAWTSKADMLIYLAIPDTLYMFKPYDLREHIPKWEKKFGTRRVKNRTWYTYGIPVPSKVFEDADWCKVRRLT